MTLTKLHKKNDSTNIQHGFEQKKTYRDTGKNVEDIRGVAIHGAKLALRQNHTAPILLERNRRHFRGERFGTLP